MGCLISCFKTDNIEYEDSENTHVFDLSDNYNYGFDEDSDSCEDYPDTAYRRRFYTYD